MKPLAGISLITMVVFILPSLAMSAQLGQSTRPSYSLIDLYPMQAQAISSDGVIAGILPISPKYPKGQPAKYYVAIWNGKTSEPMKSLGVFGMEGTEGTLLAIAAVAGQYMTGTLRTNHFESGRFDAIIVQGGKLSIATPPDPNDNSEAVAINIYGALAGQVYTGVEHAVFGSPGKCHAMTYENGRMSVLDKFDDGESSHLTDQARYIQVDAINDSGAIAGQILGYGRAFIGFAWTRGKFEQVGLVHGSDRVYLNNRGLIAYTEDDPGWGKAVLWQNGKVTTLGAFAVRGMNDSGCVVGDAETSSPAFSAVLFCDGRLYHLSQLVGPRLKVTVTQAIGISDDGRILAVAGPFGKEHRFDDVLLRPNSRPAP